MKKKFKPSISNVKRIGSIYTKVFNDWILPYITKEVKKIVIKEKKKK
jgi:hypothetical protein